MDQIYAVPEPLINVIDVNLAFGDRVILSNININLTRLPDYNGIRRARMIALVGISGKGKSQLLRILAGLTHLSGPKVPLTGWKKIFAFLVGHEQDETHVTGQVLIGKDQIPVQEGSMGVIFQEYYMPAWLRIKAMLIKAAKKNPIYKRDKKLILEAVMQIMTEFELIDHINKYPCQLSGGQRQRANIAMQLLNGSDYILMDEPYSGLDPLMIDKITNLLRKVSITDPQKTFIIVSHDLENCLAIADTVYILSDKGREENTGATIIDHIDLIAKGLAWREDVKRLPAFHDVIAQVKTLLA